MNQYKSIEHKYFSMINSFIFYNFELPSNIKEQFPFEQDLKSFEIAINKSYLWNSIHLRM